MQFSQLNILFFARTMKLGGTENVVLQLCEIFKDKVNKIVVCSCGGVNENKLKELGVKHYTIPDIESSSPKTMLKVFKKLSKIIKEEDISAIHSHHRMAAFYSSFSPSARRCIKLATAHNTFSNKRFLTRLAYKNTHVIACGDMVRKNLVDYFKLKKSRVSVVHNAVKPFNQQVIACPELTKLKQQGYYLVGNVGRLTEQKGMRYFIEALPYILKQKGKKIKFIIIGDGEEKEALKKLVKELQLENDVILLGYRSDVQNIMSQLDLLVLSSLWEGLPLTPIEAFSVGKTIVATAVDGTVEIVKDNENGYLIQPKTPQQIADAVIKLYENPETRQNMEQSAKKTFEQGFSFEIFEGNYLRIYKDLCAKKYT